MTPKGSGGEMEEGFAPHEAVDAALEEFAQDPRPIEAAASAVRKLRLNFHYAFKYVKELEWRLKQEPLNSPRGLFLAETAHRLLPQDGHVAMDRARRLLSSGFVDRAISAYIHAAELEPGNIRIYTDLAAILVENGKFSDALEWSSKIPDEIGRLLQARSLIGLGKYQDAYERVKEDADPRSRLVLARAQIGIARQERDPDKLQEALSILTPLREGDTVGSDPVIKLCILCNALLNKKEEAIDDLVPLLKKKPHRGAVAAFLSLDPAPALVESVKERIELRDAEIWREGVELSKTFDWKTNTWASEKEHSSTDA